MKLSDEQQDIITTIGTNNVIVEAVPGSGKTTVAMHIALYYNHLNILLITYSAKLKVEVREKINNLGIKNCVANTFHACIINYYNDGGINADFTDTRINEIIEKNIPPKRPICFDIFILDETQDMTDLYYRLFVKIYSDNLNKGARICVLGDRYQCIYRFKNSDSRYLTLADAIFQSEKPWVRKTLRLSYRLTPQICDFINNCMLTPEDRKIVPVKLRSGHRQVEYFVYDPYHDNGYTIRSIIVELKNEGYKPSDILICAYSLAKKDFETSRRPPICVVENSIKNYFKDTLNIYMPKSDDMENANADVMAHKLCMLTFHQTKGLEKKVVVVLGFDDSYFRYYDRDNRTPDICPELLYVACSRASERLILVHYAGSGAEPKISKPLSFLRNFQDITNKTLINPYCNKYYIFKSSGLSTSFALKNDNRKEREFRFRVTDLIKYIPTNIIVTIDKLFKTVELFPRKNTICLPSKLKNIISNDDISEDVSDINGTFIPALYQLIHYNNTPILDNVPGVSYPVTMPLNQGTIEKFLSHIIASDCRDRKIVHRGYQIRDRTWITNELITQCFGHIDTLELPRTDCVVFEQHIAIMNKFTNNMNSIILDGFADCIYETEDYIELYEFKCTSCLTFENKLQLLLYAFILTERNKNAAMKPIRLFLFNILTCELLEIICPSDQVKQIADIIIDYKLKNAFCCSDEDFIKNRNSEWSVIQTTYEHIECFIRV